MVRSLPDDTQGRLDTRRGGRSMHAHRGRVVTDVGAQDHQDRSPVAGPITQEAAESVETADLDVWLHRCT
jgi:hypothetical protein